LNFKEKKPEIEDILKIVFAEKCELITKANSLYSYIDPEFFDKSYEDDIKVTNKIEKSLHVVKDLILSQIKTLNEEDEELEFYSSKFTHENYEPILYLYGNSPEKKIKFKTLPKTIKEEESFFIIIDFTNGFYLLPWS
jgi:hypothetical protein